MGNIQNGHFLKKCYNVGLAVFQSDSGSLLLYYYPLFNFYQNFTLFWQITLKSEDYGKHLLGVQDLIQKHTLSETDITTQTEWAKALKTQAQKFVEEKHPDSAKITSKANELDAACERLHTHSKHRLSMLKVSSTAFMQFRPGWECRSTIIFLRRVPSQSHA